MAEIILHQYPNSPFSEKVRKILALKKVTWRSVDQPVIMPKPKLIPLTGGYRRIPVLQIGADVWCDSQVIVRKIDELYPEPTMYPGNSEGICNSIALFADRRFFFSTTPVIFEKLAASVPKEFIEDRSKMMAGSGANFTELTATAPDARNQVRAFLEQLAHQVSDRQFVLGGSFSLADAAYFHCVWFLRAEPSSFALAERYPSLMQWFERVEKMGVGNVTPMEPDEALKIAKDSKPATREQFDETDPNGLKPGMTVSVTPDDYGFDPVTGKVVVSTIHEIAIERNDAEVGAIVNHFPKVGFRIKAA